MIIMLVEMVFQLQASRNHHYCSYPAIFNRLEFGFGPNSSPYSEKSGPYSEKLSAKWPSYQLWS